MCGEVGRVNQILIVLAHGSVTRGMLVWMFIPKPSSPYLGGDLTIYMSWVWMRNSSMDLSSVTNYYPISLLPFPPNLFKESTYLVSSSSFFFFFLNTLDSCSLPNHSTKTLAVVNKDLTTAWFKWSLLVRFNPSTNVLSNSKSGHNPPDAE